MEAPKVSAPTEDDLDWIQMKKDFGSLQAETAREKMRRKFKENPLVPIGCLATASALTYGLWSFRQGKRQMSQYMMRVRIGAQGFTVMALIAGVAMTYKQKKTT